MGKRFKAMLLLLIFCLPGGLAAAQNQDSKRGDKMFLNGADISMLTKVEENGGKFKLNGEVKDFFEIMKSYGMNSYRLRLFVKPNYEGGVVNDLPYTIQLAKRIKAAGMVFILDFHYSDTWADPQHQIKPEDWEGLDFPALTQKVEDYTSEVIATCKDNGVLPEIVQIGNEIRAGMIWPEGRVGNAGDDQTVQWNQLTELIKAGIRGVHGAVGGGDQVKIMIHTDQGANRGHTKWFFDNLHQHDIDYDIIGLSYYPWWHGTMQELRDNLIATANDYGKPIIVAEAAYPYFDMDNWWQENRGDTLEYPLTVDGQRQFLADVICALEAIPNDLGLGILYWYPEAVPVGELEVWNNGHTALFDLDFNALSSMSAFQKQPSISAGSWHFFHLKSFPIM